MLNIGPQELLLILIVALVIVGPQRLPQLARSLAGFLRSLRAAQDEMRRTVNEVLDPAVIADATEDLRRARDEVGDALRPGPAAHGDGRSVGPSRTASADGPEA